MIYLRFDQSKESNTGLVSRNYRSVARDPLYNLAGRCVVNIPAAFFGVG